MVISSNETEGYGDRIHDLPPDSAGRGVPPFQLQFWGKRLSDLTLEPAPAGTGIAAITRATDTCRAVVEAARQAAERVIAKTRELYGAEE